MSASSRASGDWASSPDASDRNDARGTWARGRTSVGRGWLCCPPGRAAPLGLPACRVTWPRWPPHTWKTEMRYSSLRFHMWVDRFKSARSDHQLRTGRATRPTSVGSAPEAAALGPTLSAFANMPRGTIILGLDESSGSPRWDHRHRRTRTGRSRSGTNCGHASGALRVPYLQVGGRPVLVVDVGALPLSAARAARRTGVPPPVGRRLRHE
jgi:hypothetical protein